MSQEEEEQSDQDIPMFVLFGRPGAGKTTVATAAIQQLQRKHCMNDVVVLGLDLDVCVSTEMRENFARGIYPNVSQRREFMNHAIQHVRQEMMQHSTKTTNQQQQQQQRLIVLISFSFVNVDLRNGFRDAFPHAIWILLDTSEELAKNRIEQRKGHFYKGKQQNEEDTPSNPQLQEATEKTTSDNTDNREWIFAPVTFPHEILLGTSAVEENANRVVEWIQQYQQQQQQQS